MTCVVGLVTETASFLGADSISVGDDGLYTISATPKVKNIRGVLVGFAGSWRVGQQAFRTIAKMRAISLETFANTFKTDENDWSLLWIQNGKLYEIGADMSYIEQKVVKSSAYCSIGTGASVALGALAVDNTGKKSVLNALRAAESHIITVRRPFVVIEQKH